MQSQSDSPSDELDLIGFTCIVLRARRLIIQIAGVIAVLVVVIVLVSARTYTVVTSFFPQASSLSTSGLLGLAAQAGFSLPGQDQTESPAFYATLVKSDRILNDVVDTSYEYRMGGDTTRSDLVSYYNIVEPSRARALAKAVERLGSHVTSSTDMNTGVVQVSVATKSADLSAAVASRVLELVNRYDAQTRQTQAGQERRFLEGRIAETKSELRQAEDKMQDFLQKNRDFHNSPQLTFAQARLQQDIDLEQGLFTTLAQSYEQARIQEAHDTPVISLLERPLAPPMPDRRHLALKALLGMLVGGLIGLVVTIVGGYATGRPVGQGGDRADLVALWEATVVELRRPWRLVWPIRKPAS